MVVPHTPSTPVSPVAACEGGRRGGGRGDGGGVSLVAALAGAHIVLGTFCLR